MTKMAELKQPLKSKGAPGEPLPGAGKSSSLSAQAPEVKTKDASQYGNLKKQPISE